MLNGTAGVDTLTQTGSGAVVMGNNPANRIYAPDSQDKLINDTAHTIRGAGQIGVSTLFLENRGLIEATQSNQLVVNGTGSKDTVVSVTNSGTMQANGGTLRIQDSNVNNTGTIVAQTGNSVIFESSRVNGTLSTVGTGTIQLQSQSVLNSNTITTGSVVVLADNQTNLVDPGTITNGGTIQMNSGGNPTDLRILNTTIGVEDQVTLTGTGVLQMGNNPQNRIYADGAEDRLINDTQHTIRGSGQIGTVGSQGVIENRGLIEATQSNELRVGGFSVGGTAPGVVNSGTLQASNGATLTLNNGVFDNQGAVRAQTGGDVVYNAQANALNLTTTPGTLIGGIWQADGNGSSISFGALHSNIVTNAADIYLVGAGSSISVNGNSIDNTLFTNNGSLRIHDGRVFTATANAGNFTNNGLIELASPTAEAQFKGNTSLTNNGTILGYGTVGNRVTGVGNIQAILGTLSVTGGATGAGNLTADGPAAVLNFSAATLASSTANLSLTNGGALNLGAQNINVTTDYNNGAFGVGNAFNHRANVSGAGLILATGDLGVSVTGAGVTNGTTATPTLALGNVHVAGNKLVNLDINATGTSGPLLRGAVQNTGISNAALVVTAQNFGPLAQGTSAPLAVNFTPTTAGALAGQSFRVVTNFDNVGPQTVSVTGAAYDYANPVVQTSQPIAFGNVHTGAVVATQGLSIQNQVITSAPFQEGLNAAAGGTTNGVTASGSFNNLAAGSTNNGGIAVGINTATAGSRNGTATVNFVSNGAGTSGLGLTPLASQNVNVTGGVYDYANAVVLNSQPINVGNFHTGASATQGVNIQNQVITNAAFQEGLNASVASTGGAAVTNGGSFTGLAAGGTNNGSIAVGLNAAASGTQTGSVTLSLVSNGTGTSGLGNTTLAQQTVQVTGTAYNLANPTLGTINLGVLHTNTGTQSVGLSVTNTLVGNASFQEGLNASFGGYTNTGTISPNFAGSLTNLGAGQTNNTSMLASVNTNTSGVGVITGNVLVNLISNGQISGLGNTNLAGQSVAVWGNVTATITSEAIPVVNNSQPVNFGNIRIGTVVAPVGLSITNGAPVGPFTEGLIANVSGTTGTGITAAGGFGSAGAGLAPQVTNNGSITVGIDTSTAGAKSGAAQINFQSDATPFGGNVTNIQPFPTDVAVQGNVYRLANPTLNTTNVTLAARVGDTSPTANVSVTNTSPDVFTEGLKASIGSTPAGFTNAGGAISNLAAAGTDASTLKVGLNTATSGTFFGQAQVNLISTGAGTTNAPDQALASQNVRAIVT